MRAESLVVFRVVFLLFAELVNFGDREKFIQAVESGKVITFAAIEDAKLNYINIYKTQERAKR